MKYIWQQFAELNNMTPKELEVEVIELAQNILSTRLYFADKDALKITSKQLDDSYELTFERIK